MEITRDNILLETVMTDILITQIKCWRREVLKDISTNMINGGRFYGLIILWIYAHTL